MKNKEDVIDFSEKGFKSRFKRIEHSERPNAANLAALRDTKSRITMYLDTNVLLKFKERAEKEHTGYQTLINDVLRRLVDEERIEAEKQSLKNDLLRDKDFLRDLKSALAG